jgi:two-component system sensor histidine kinase HydH
MTRSENGFQTGGLTRRWVVQPRYILAVAGLVAMLVFGSSIYEQTQDREEILGVMHDQAQALAQAVAQSAENAVYADAELEQEIVARLTNNARLLDRLETQHGVSSSALKIMAQEIEVSNIVFYSSRGQMMLASHPEGAMVSEAFVQRVLISSESVVLSGYRTGASLADGYAVGYRRPEGGIVIRDDAGRMLGLRRRFGVGRLVQDIGRKTGVAYVVIQDQKGILAASSQVRQMSTIQVDAFLQDAMEKQREQGRFFLFEEKNVFEVVQPFVLSGVPSGLLRIGLWPDALNAAEGRAKTRLIWMSGGLLVAGVILLNFLMLKQNFDAVNQAYRQIRTYTGDVLEHMADGVVVVDREGKITTFNRAAELIFGYQASDVIGRSCGEIVRDQTPILEQSLQRGEGLTDVECRYQTNRGKELVLSISTSILWSDNQAVDACIAVIKDLTQQKKMEEDAKRQERLAAMGELAAGVAHEIRNPLNAIDMTVQRFGAEFTPVENRSEYDELVRIVESELNRVNGIVEQFLRLARPPKLTPKLTDVDALIRDLVTVIDRKTASKDLMLKLDLQLDKSVIVDREQLTQAVLNLLLNAVDATPQGGEISVASRLAHSDAMPFETEAEGQWTVLTVADTGVGMDEDVLARIFDPYFTTKDGGTGLGLSLVGRIIEEHGGRIDVKSQVGVGTTFSMFLPEK